MEKPVLELFLLCCGSTPVTEIHSFATISDNSFAVGYHGDIGPDLGYSISLMLSVLW